MDFGIVHHAEVVGLSAHDDGAFRAGLVHFLNELFDGTLNGGHVGTLADGEDGFLRGIGVGSRLAEVERVQIALVGRTDAEVDNHDSSFQKRLAAKGL